MRRLAGLGEFILRSRWVFMSLLGGLMVFYQLEEHRRQIPQQLNFSFLFEVLVMGFVLPALGGSLLTRLARYKAEYARNKEHLDRSLLLFQDLIKRQEWEELRKFVVQYPGTIFPLDRTSLYIYDHRLARLEFAAEWNDGEAASPPVSDRSLKICQVCLSNQTMLLRQADPQCPFVPVPEAHSSGEFCLALLYDKVLIGVLRLTCKPDRTLAPEQVEFMNAVVPHLALALTRTIAQPRQMAHIRFQTQMMERQQTAADLHNSLAQQLSYLHLGLDRLANGGQLEASDPVRQEIEAMRQVASEAYEQVRSTLTLLRSWESVDLTQAIADYFLKVAQRAHLSNVFTTAGEPMPLEPELRRQIFNLFQEGMNNVEKHARARHVQVSLVWTADRLLMSIIDDGVGFDPLSAQTDGHYGLMIMRELIYVLQGELEMNSSPGQGTRLNFTIPLVHVQSRALGDQTLPVLPESPH